MANNGTHFDGPLLGTDRGPLHNLPVAVNVGLQYPTECFWFNDFIGQADYETTNDWTATAIGGGVLPLLTPNDTGVTGGGVLSIVSLGQNAGSTSQADGLVSARGVAAGLGAAGMSVAMGARFSMKDASTTDVFVGFAELNLTSDVLTAAGALTSDNHAGFHTTLADGGAFRFSAAGNSFGSALTTENVFTAEDFVYVDVAMRLQYPGKYTAYYRQGKDLQKVAGFAETTNPWDGEMFPTFSVVTDAASDTLVMDYIWFACNR